MSQRVSLINGKNKNQDYDLAKIFQSLGNSGVAEGLEVQSGNITSGYAFVNITRDGKTFPVLFSLDSNLSIDTSGTKKVFIEINQANIDDGSINNPDGTGIGEIRTASSYPSTNYIKLASISSGSITDEREFIKGYFAKTNTPNNFTEKQSFGDIEVNNASINSIKTMFGQRQNFYVGVNATGNGSGSDGNNRMAWSGGTICNNFKTEARVHFLLADGIYELGTGIKIAKDIYFSGASKTGTIIKGLTADYDFYGRNIQIGRFTIDRGNLIFSNLTLETSVAFNNTLPWSYPSWNYRGIINVETHSSGSVYFGDCQFNVKGGWLIGLNTGHLDIHFRAVDATMTDDARSELVSVGYGTCTIGFLYWRNITAGYKFISGNEQDGTFGRIGQNVLSNETDLNKVDYVTPASYALISSDNLKISADTARGASGANTVKLKEFQMGLIGGEIKLSYYCDRNNYGSGTFVKVNNETVWSIQEDYDHTYTININVNPGDKISIWYTDTGSDSSMTISNARIYYDVITVPTNDTVLLN